MTTVPVHKEVHGRDAAAATVASLQTAIGGLTVSRSVDGQHLGAKIIEMQKRLVVLGKMTAGQVNISIDDQHLAAKLAAVETASNLP